MENLTQLINLVIAIISGLVLILTIASLVIKWFKDGNWKKINVLVSQIPELVIQAEKMFGKGKGVDKFKWVLTMLRNIALQTKTSISDEALGNYINDVVDATNNVNVDKFPFEKENNESSAELDVHSENSETSFEFSEIMEVKE